MILKQLVGLQTTCRRASADHVLITGKECDSHLQKNNDFLKLFLEKQATSPAFCRHTAFFAWVHISDDTFHSDTLLKKLVC